MSKAIDPYQPLNNLKVSGNLPVIPQVLVKLIDLCHQSEVNLLDVSGLVKKDAALAAKILQLCNSAFIGARSSFVDIHQSTVYLGVNAIKNLAISVSVQQVFRRVETNGLLNVDRFWYHSYQNAILAQRIAEAVEYPNPSEAYLAGLLHDIGKLLLWMAFPGKYAPLLLKGIRCHNGRLSFLEQEKLHINHCDAGAWLAEQWGLPPLICDAIRYHHHPTDEVARGLPLTRTIFLADLISHSDNPEEEYYEVADQFFRLAPEHMEKLVEGVDEQVVDIAQELGIRIPNKSTSALKPEPESESVHKETSTGLISRIRDITQLTGFLDNLLKAKDKNQVAATLEQSLKILFNEEHSFLLLLHRATNTLTGFASSENVLSGDVASLRFNIERHEKSLPARAMELRQPVHSFMNQMKDDTTLLDTQLARVTGDEGIVVIPMYYQHKTVGLIVIGVSEKNHSNLLNQATPLQLLSGQAAVSLYMQQWQEQQCERIGAERLQSASLLARKIAHEINNPLAILRNYLKILDLKLEGQTDIHEELSIMNKEFIRIGEITDQLRDISAARSIPRREKMDFNETLNEIIRLYTASRLGEGEIQITFSPGHGFPKVNLDSNALKQIITNLLNNSVDALGNKGMIHIATSIESKTEPSEIILTVADNGPGVEDSIRETLFQAGITNKDGAHGGLGLAIVRKNITELGGTISVSSNSEGTTFSISLPLTPSN